MKELAKRAPRNYKYVASGGAYMLKGVVKKFPWGMRMTSDLFRGVARKNFRGPNLKGAKTNFP